MPKFSQIVLIRLEGGDDTFPFSVAPYKTQCDLLIRVSPSLNTFLCSHVSYWLGFSVSSMNSTFAFPGVEELYMESKVLDVPAFISFFRGLGHPRQQLNPTPTAERHKNRCTMQPSIAIGSWNFFESNCLVCAHFWYKWDKIFLTGVKP